MKFLMFVYILLVVSCSTSLTKDGFKVKISTNIPNTCKEIGDINEVEMPLYGEGSACDIKSLKNSLKNKAAKLNANYIRIDALSAIGGKNCLANGVAYFCPNNI